ncbi:succinylglutamate-semialdehyde dehydrogenase [Novosphingobium sp.]|uniref:succinylglutamate-semialdehyde dehydrogenase n=1 Tax=Novosphingobium sp. TaxID=1874826 RepID=UPI00333F1B29
MAASHEIISHEPATGVELWRGPIGDVGALVARARRAWPGWAAQPHTIRIEMARRFANEVRKEHDRLATLIARETGRPLWEARGEVEDVVGRVEIAVRAYAERTAQRRLDSALQGTAALRHKPHGVIAVITPASAPASVATAQIIPALIAGNVVVFKPSERTPATGELLVQCMHRAGIPAAAVQMLVGGPDQGQDLAAHDSVNAVLFTGSAHVGIALNRRLSGNPGKLVALELGGNNPIVVWDTPKIAEAAVLVAQSAFASAGQRCTAARRLIVKASLADDIIEEVRRLADRMIVGAPFDDPAPFMGPVIDNPTADGLTESFVYLLSNGGRAIKHLVRLDDAHPFLSPAIIDVTRMTERPDVELFGPLLQVVVVDEFEAAIAEANATRFGLCAALIGGAPQDYNRFWAQVQAGVINWNRPTHAHSGAAPMGGVGLSGNHRPAAYYAADSCAYPVASAELDQPRAGIGVGLRDG